MEESETGRPAVYFQKKKKKQDTKTAVRNLCVKIIAKYWCSPQGLGKKKERTQGKKRTSEQRLYVGSGEPANEYKADLGEQCMCPGKGV